ncbi:MAG: hypothetical protein HYX92_06785 [Chloroflexi bacterium]|nr:hypothetical protein [Chloroflexota bacterium]
MAGAIRSSIIEMEDSFEAVNDYAYKKGWTDGLPIVPPTEERVAAMIEATGLDPQEEIVRIPPALGKATVEKIVVNAVMAGCLPEYVPVIIAGLRAMGEAEFNLHGIQTTTNPVTPASIINGPVRKSLDINCGPNCLGQGWRANATIGRAIRLLLLNVGGGVPGPVDKATHGQPGKYTLCFGEDEEGSVWEPLHVERGFRPDQSAVTVVGVAETSHISTARTRDAREILMLLADNLGRIGTNDMNQGGGNPTIVLASGHAGLFQAAGYSKTDVKRVLYENSSVPVDRFPEIRVQLGIIRVENGRVYPAKRAEDIILVVAGASEPYHATCMHTFGSTRAQTVAI